jgi:hypothetical protein
MERDKSERNICEDLKYWKNLLSKMATPVSKTLRLHARQQLRNSFNMKNMLRVE